MHRHPFGDRRRLDRRQIDVIFGAEFFPRTPAILERTKTLATNYALRSDFATNRVNADPALRAARSPDVDLGAPGRFIFALVWCYTRVLIGAGTAIDVALSWLASQGLAALIVAHTDILIDSRLG